MGKVQLYEGVLEKIMPFLKISKFLVLYASLFMLDNLFFSPSTLMAF